MAAKGYRVFISYSRANEDRKNRLMVHLVALKADSTISIWHDRCIEAGDLWREELDQAMSNADVALFLVSADFLGSRFCQDVEVPRMLERHYTEGVLIVPIIVDYCDWKPVKWLSQFQVLPEDGNPVPAQKPHSKAWTQVARGLRLRLENNPPRKATFTAPVVVQSEKEPERLSLQKLLQDLPGESGKLFGRDEALSWVDDAYDDPQISVLALIGFGGIGKSALVRHWLENRDLVAKGVTRFLGCSFYSQGTREQVGSSDQFLIQALEMLGEPKPGLMSAWDRGQRLAELVASERTVLMLDGLEPLQYGPGPHQLEGRLKDPGIHGLLDGLVAKPGKSLCILTSRLKLNDDSLQVSSCVQKLVGELSMEAARELLIYRGVCGSYDELNEAVDYLGRHPLALVFAAEYLHTFAEGRAMDVKTIPLLSEKTKEGRHAWSVMEAYEIALRRDGDPLDLELLSVLGLFDRPAKWQWLKVLCSPPVIIGVTDQLISASDRALWESISRLRQWGMLTDPGLVERPELDAHPLIREYFGERLKRENNAGWRAAHSRLFDHLSSTAKTFPETINEMEPLYQAVFHGCQAGRYTEALNNIYRERILRGNQFFSTRKLGAFGADLAALSGFFDALWHQPVAGLTQTMKARVLNLTSFRLQALGRLVEAVQPMQAGLESDIAQEDWVNAAIAASNLSQLYLTIGDLDKALASAQQSIDLSERSGNTFWRITSQTTLANVLHQVGCLSEAEAAFRKAEKMHKKIEPLPFLYSHPGFQYCDLLLDQGKYREVQSRANWASKFYESAKQATGERIHSLLDIALINLSRGLAYLMLAIQKSKNDFSKAASYLEQAVDDLRKAGAQEFIARGLLARAELYLATCELELARDDLEEAMSTANRGGMGLHQADCYLKYARLYLAMLEMDKARVSLAIAKEMIERIGYHRRDKDVRDIEEKLREKL